MSRLSINAPNNLLVLDWDGTLAASDTLSLISPSPRALEPYTKAYMHDMKKLSERFGARDSLPKMTQWLGAMQEIEYASVKRVEDGGLFKGALRQDLLSRAQDQTKLQLQQGASDLLKTYKGKWGIVSVGWSGMFIQAALESRGVDTSSNSVGIFANEVCFDDQGVGTGIISKHEGNDRGIRTAQDKQREMRIMVKGWKEGPQSDGRIIYIGDSETDLLCLLEADVGIIMNSPGMVGKCRNLGLQVVDGFQQHGDTDKGRSLYYVRDFNALIDD